MKHRLLLSVLLPAVMLVSYMTYGQHSPGPGPKRARTRGDYKPRLLKEVAALGSNTRKRTDLDAGPIIHGDILPSRVRVTYAGRARSLPEIKQDVLHRWAQRYAGAPGHYTVPYETELLFKEHGRKYWGAVKKDSLVQFDKDVKKGDALDLYLIRLGWTGAPDKWEPLLLVESFQKRK